MNELFGTIIDTTVLVQARSFRNLCTLLIEKGVLTAAEVEQLVTDARYEVESALSKLDETTAADSLFGR